MAKFGALNKVTQPKFYCKKSCGDPDFSIDEWNQAFKYCEEAGIEGVERDKILSPELFPCVEQCESCINTVLDTQLSNKKKREQRERMKQKFIDAAITPSIEKPTLCECGSNDFLSKSVKAGTWIGNTPFKTQVDLVVTKCTQCRKTDYQ